MGSPEILNTTPVPHAMEDRKTIKNLLTKPIKAFAAWTGHGFQSKKKEKEHEIKKEKEHEIKKETETDETIVRKDGGREKIDVDQMVENFHKLHILKERENKIPVHEEDDDDENFSYKIVKDDDEVSCKENVRTGRTGSNLSGDSGFSEKHSFLDKEGISTESTRINSDEDRTISDRSRTISETVSSDSETVKTHSERVRTQSEKSTLLLIKTEYEVVKSLSELKLEDGKKKKLHTVAVSRGPILNKRDYAASSHPYNYDVDGNIKQINQINKQTFSGGQVIYNAPRIDDYNEFEVALKTVQRNHLQYPQSPEQQEENWQILQEVIAADEFTTVEDKSTTAEDTEENILEEFIQSQTDILANSHITNSACADIINEPDPIEEFHHYEQCQNLEYTNLDEDLTNICQNFQYTNVDKNLTSINEIHNGHVFPTPPRSENMSSPESISSFHPSNSDYTLSPGMSYTLSPGISSPSNNDYEKFQEIAQYEDHIPITVSEHVDEVTEKKARERNASASSMTMKQYKDLQKELSMGFSKKECCQTNRKSTKEVFDEYAQKLRMEERKNLAFKVASIELDQCYGVLQQILLCLSRGSEQEDLHIALFRLVCDRLMGEKPALFVGELGLNLLKAASLRCPTRPILTRYLVECVRSALKQDPSLVSEEYIYREVDVQGDTLAIACTRGGDTYADVLFELVHTEANAKPLFNVQHGNAEGYSALHVACQQHSAAAPCLHIAHVLLEHGGADLWKGDVKGDDTALHLAVNSATCDLKLIMVLFRHEDRKMWHELSHVYNRSSVTPLAYARSAAKTTTRKNYPKEVLEFLKKCRQIKST